MRLLLFLKISSFFKLLIKTKILFVFIKWKIEYNLFSLLIFMIWVSLSISLSSSLTICSSSFINFFSFDDNEKFFNLNFDISNLDSNILFLLIEFLFLNCKDFNSHFLTVRLLILFGKFLL